VLLCANCHREAHAGLRSFGDAGRLSEPAARYSVEECGPAA
jgi:hypothetical protein